MYLIFGSGMFKAGERFPIPLRDNLVFEEASLDELSTYYSDPFDLIGSVYANLYCDYTPGELLSTTIILQSWNGVDWIDDRGADGSTRWSLALTTMNDNARLIGDLLNQHYAHFHTAWRMSRFKIETGSSTGALGSLTLRLAAK